jgi:hypothetical protein
MTGSRPTHTPGPWKARIVVGPGCGSIVTESGRYIASISTQTGTGEANAALIAAAPDLLQSLKEVFQLAAIFNHDADPIWAAVRDKAKAAIAKAEGK